MLKTLLHHPRKLWLRRALFQIHLWLGVLLSLYIAVIGLSGSILVYEDELRHMTATSAAPSQPMAKADEVVRNIRAANPGRTPSYLTLPTADEPHWTVYLIDTRGNYTHVDADYATGNPLPQTTSAVDFVHDLHESLLAGTKGFIVNCTMGSGLLVLTLTGIVLWWPGIRNWARGFLVNWRGRWKRVNYDLHSAIGIWTLLIVSWWSISAVYFLLPKQISGMVNAVSPLRGMKEPNPVAQDASASGPALSIEDLIVQQRRVSPGRLTGMTLAAKPGGSITMYVNVRAPGDFMHRDVDTFDGRTGRLLTQWHYGNNQTLGDWIVWLMYPLHAGTLWGPWVKALWALLGLSLPVLSITGLLMYWNRYLGGRWKAVRGN